MTLTTTWLPIAPPTVRMFAFMPVATPVCGGRHRLDDQVRHRREGEPHAEARHAERDVHLPVRAVRERQEPERTTSEEPANASGTFEPTAAVIRPIANPTTIIATVAGSSARPALR